MQPDQCARSVASPFTLQNAAELASACCPRRGGRCPSRILGTLAALYWGAPTGIEPTDANSNYLVTAAVVQPGEQRAHVGAGRALGEVAVVGLRPGRPGDVQVHPRSPVDELLEEQARGEGGAVAVDGHVLEVGQHAVEVLAVLLGQRQPPGALAGLAGRLQQLARQGV